MKYFSMFSGIGGFELGIQSSWIQSRSDREEDNISYQSNIQCPKGANRKPKPVCVGYSEINKYAIQIYEKHFKGHKNYGDCTKIKWEEVEIFDILVGGFPCQAFSIAGNRQGFNDIRGTLFFEIARCLREKQPRLFLLENVKGLLSNDKGNTFLTILTTLDELGYDCQWQVLNSKGFGVPQTRERVFIVGHLRGICRPEVFPIGETSSKNIKKLAKEGGNHNGEGLFDLDGVSPSLTSGGTGGATNNCPKVMRQPLRFLGRNQKNIEGDYSFTIDGSQTSGVNINSKIRRLTPTECERLQGFPDGWTEGISDTQRYKCLGNAVTVNVIEAIMNKLVD